MAAEIHIVDNHIEAFPQALDVADAFNETPHAFYQKHFRDVEEVASVEEEIANLSEEVSRFESPSRGQI